MRMYSNGIILDSTVQITCTAGRSEVYLQVLFLFIYYFCTTLGQGKKAVNTTDISPKYRFDFFKFPSSKTKKQLCTNNSHQAFEVLFLPHDECIYLTWSLLHLELSWFIFNLSRCFCCIFSKGVKAIKPKQWSACTVISFQFKSNYLN